MNFSTDKLFQETGHMTVSTTRSYSTQYIVLPKDCTIINEVSDSLSLTLFKKRKGKRRSGFGVSLMGTYLDPFTFRKDIKFSLEGNKDPLTNKSEFERLQELANFKNSSMSKLTRQIVLEYLVKNGYTLSNNPKIEEFIKEDGTEKHYNEPTLADYQTVHLEFIQNADLPLDELLRRANACMNISKLYDNAYQLRKEAEFEKRRQARLKEKLSPHLKNEELWIG